jgi:sec-independent protein translocase protein TatA
MGGLGAPEIILIIIAILIMKGLGKGMKEFKDAQNGENNATTSGTTTNTEEKPKV